MRARALLAAGLAAGLASEPPVFAMPAGVAPPSLALTCRVYARAVGVLIASLLDSHAIFWPGESLWPASSVALVWDAESEDDRKKELVSIVGRTRGEMKRGAQSTSSAGNTSPGCIVQAQRIVESHMMIQERMMRLKLLISP